MSENYIVGEVIDFSTEPDPQEYHLGEGAHTDVAGFRLYGTAETEAYEGSLMLSLVYSYNSGQDEIARTFTLPHVENGSYYDEILTDTDYFSDPDHTDHYFYITAGVGDWNPIISMLTFDPAIIITDRYAVIDVDGDAEVKFIVPHSVYGIYGENIKASLNEGFEDTDQGVYDTADTGKATIAHYTEADRLYLKGTGTVKIWAGQSPLDDPFAV